MADVDLNIDQRAAEPKRFAGDNGSVDQQPLRDLMEVEKYEQTKVAMANNPRRGIRFSKLIPPGSN